MPTPIANSFAMAALRQEVPEGFWRLGDAVGSTVAFDQGRNVDNGVVNGTVTYGQTGWPVGGDKAALFNGTTGYINAGNLAQAAFVVGFTVVATFKTTDNTHFLGIVGKCVSSTKAGWGLALDSGAVRFFAYTSTPAAVFDTSSPLTTYADGNFHQVIAVYDPLETNTVTITIDGSVVRTVTPAALIPDSNTARLLIGAFDNSGAGASFFNGTLDEAGIYSYAFASQQRTDLYAARLKSTNDKALMFSRSGQLRSGASRGNYFTTALKFYLNGVDVTTKVEKSTLEIIEQVGGQPSTARVSFSENGVTGTITPSYGGTFVVTDGAVDNRIFGGSIVQLAKPSIKVPDGVAIAQRLSDTQLQDWTWLLNRRCVTKAYPAGTGATIAVGDILATYCPTITAYGLQAAPALTYPVAFIGVKVQTAITQICQALSPNWNFRIDPYGNARFFQVDTLVRPTPIIPGTYSYDGLAFTLDITQIRTRMLVQGGGASTTAPVAIGATSIAVDECAWYSAFGGTVVAPEGILITYTGVTALSGPGFVTGVPASGAGAVTVPLLQGDQLSVWVQVDDTTAQTALGALELDINGATTDGIHEQFLAISNGTIAECQQAGLADLAAYKSANVTGTLTTRDRTYHAGALMTINLPIRGISLTSTVQQVRAYLLTTNKWEYEVQFAAVWRDIIDVFKRAGQAA